MWGLEMRGMLDPEKSGEVISALKWKLCYNLSKEQLIVLLIGFYLLIEHFWHGL